MDLSVDLRAIYPERWKAMELLVPPVNASLEGVLADNAKRLPPINILSQQLDDVRNGFTRWVEIKETRQEVVDVGRLETLEHLLQDCSQLYFLLSQHSSNDANNIEVRALVVSAEALFYQIAKTAYAYVIGFAKLSKFPAAQYGALLQEAQIESEELPAQIRTATSPSVKYSDLIKEDVLVGGKAVALNACSEILRDTTAPQQLRKEAFLACATTCAKSIRQFASIYQYALTQSMDATRKGKQSEMYAFRSTLRYPHGFDPYSISEAVLQCTQHYRASRQRLSKGPSPYPIEDVFLRPQQDPILSDPTLALNLIEDAATQLDPQFGRIVKSLRDNDRIRLYGYGKLPGFAHAAAIPGYGSFVVSELDGSPRSIFLTAHEIGHGIHATLLSERSYFLGMQSPLTHEAIAQLIGLCAAQALYQQIDAARRQNVRDALVELVYFSMFRRAGFAEFDNQNLKRMEAGDLTAELLAANWTDSARKLWGDLYKLDERFGSLWALAPWVMNKPLTHPIYVHSNVLALLLHKALVSAPRSNLVELLKLGGSITTEQFFKEFGIDAFDPRCVLIATNYLEELFPVEAALI